MALRVDWTAMGGMAAETIRAALNQRLGELLRKGKATAGTTTTTRDAASFQNRSRAGSKTTPQCASLQDSATASSEEDVGTASSPTRSGVGGGGGITAASGTVRHSGSSTGDMDSIFRTPISSPVRQRHHHHQSQSTAATNSISRAADKQQQQHPQHLPGSSRFGAAPSSPAGGSSSNVSPSSNAGEPVSSGAGKPTTTGTTAASPTGGSGSGRGGLGPLEELVMTHLDLGDAPPYIELLHIGSAIPELDSTALSSSSTSGAVGGGFHSNSYDDTDLDGRSSGTGCSGLERSNSNVAGGASEAELNAAISSMNQSMCSADDNNADIINNDSAETYQQQPRNPNQQSQQQSPHDPNVERPDTLAQFIGDSGLLLRLHVTYGGSMSCSVACNVVHSHSLSPTCSIGVSLPINFDVSHIHLDFILNVNCHKNKIHCWIESSQGNDGAQSHHSRHQNVMTSSSQERSGGGGSSSSVGGGGGSSAGGGLMNTYGLTNISIVTSIGSKAAQNALLWGYGDVCIDETVISKLVVSELRGLLRRKLHTPHFVCFSV